MTNKEMMVLDEMINLTNVPEEELSKHSFGYSFLSIIAYVHFAIKNNRPC